MLSGWTGNIERSLISHTDIPEQMRCRCLLERFRDFNDDILRFARDWRVPYTNNTAETATEFPATGDSQREGQREGFRVFPLQIRHR